MSKIKLDDRIENAMNAFFETEPERGALAMRYGVHDELIISAKPAFSEKFGEWSTLLRELVLFGPGTFLLFFLTLFVIFFYPTVGLPFQAFIAIATASFITFAGAGDIRNVKNLAVPATVIVIVSAVGVIRSVFPVPEYVSPYFSWAFCSFPFALIAAKLVQMWLAEKK